MLELVPEFRVVSACTLRWSLCIDHNHQGIFPASINMTQVNFFYSCNLEILCALDNLAFWHTRISYVYRIWQRMTEVILSVSPWEQGNPEKENSECNIHSNFTSLFYTKFLMNISNTILMFIRLNQSMKNIWWFLEFHQQMVIYNLWYQY